MLDFNPSESFNNARHPLVCIQELERLWQVQVYKFFADAEVLQGLVQKYPSSLWEM